MAFRTTPQLGPSLNERGTGFQWDGPGATEPSYRLGNKEVGNDGHDYVWVKASATIAAAASPGTQITITEPAFTAAAGAGGFYAPVAGVASGDYFHARKSTL